MINLSKIKICVVGLGYVGLPLAVLWGKSKIAPVLGFDISKKRILELRKNKDLTGEISEKELENTNIIFSWNPKIISNANFIVVAIPTPINKKNFPDLSMLKSASKIIGKNIKKNTIVVFESTVYPGVTEEICGKIIQKYSGLKLGKDFKLGYSPERINPGDKKHTIDKIIKIVSAQDKSTLAIVEKVYSLICKAGVYKVKDIKTAEAAKVIENVQRDINIALVNELSLIFHKLGIDTNEVLKASATKWNFQYFRPGLVGGHCIPVDPYYLAYKAKKLGYHPKIILAGREVNEYMPKYIAYLLFSGLKQANKKIKKSKILICGLTFKENVRDFRNSKIIKTIRILHQKKCKVFGYDPFLNKNEILKFNITPILNFKNSKIKFDGIIIPIIHKQFKKLKKTDFERISTKPVVLIDIRGFFKDFMLKNFIYKSL